MNRFGRFNPMLCQTPTSKRLAIAILTAAALSFPTAGIAAEAQVNPRTQVKIAAAPWHDENAPKSKYIKR